MAIHCFYASANSDWFLRADVALPRELTSCLETAVWISSGQASVGRGAQLTFGTSYLTRKSFRPSVVTFANVVPL